LTAIVCLNIRKQSPYSEPIVGLAVIEKRCIADLLINVLGVLGTVVSIISGFKCTLQRWPRE